MTVKQWLGTAADILDSQTITVANTWTQGDTVTLTINNNNLVLTIGTSTSTANVATIIANGVNATSKTDNLQGDETRNIGGQQIPEFTEIEATSSASVVTVDAVIRGIPITLAAVASTASDGDVTLATAQSATGKNFFDNAANWTGNAVPVTGDRVVFQNNNVDCLYGLAQSAIEDVEIQIDASYTGKIGLPLENANGYSEYRTRHLTIKCTNTARSVVIGAGPGNGSSRINLDTSTSDAKVEIVATGTREANAKAAVDLLCSGSDVDVAIRKGSLSLGADSVNSAAVDLLEITYTTQQDTDAAVYIQESTTINTINKSGGFCQSINGSASVTIGTVTNRSGILDVNGRVNVTTLNMQGGTCRWQSTGTLGTLTLSGAAIVDFSRDNASKTITNPVERHSNESQFIDPAKVTGSVVIDNNQVSDTSNLTLGTDFRITRGATA